MSLEDLQSRLNKKIAVCKKAGNLPVDYDYLRLLVIRNEDWDHVRDFGGMLAIVTSVAANNGLILVDGKSDQWDLPPRITPAESAITPNYQYPKKGEGKPAHRLHKNTGKELFISGQDRSRDDEPAPAWNINRYEW